MTNYRAKWAIRDCREWPHNYFAKIARSQAQKRFIIKEDNLKVNPCRKRKPIELFCPESRYMRESRNEGNQTSSRIKDRLQWSQAGYNTTLRIPMCWQCLGLLLSFNSTSQYLYMYIKILLYA